MFDLNIALLGAFISDYIIAAAGALIIIPIVGIVSAATDREF